MITMNHNTQTIENTGVAPGSAREPENRDISRFHTWGDDLKPENEGLTAEEYEFLASVDSEGGFV